MAVADWFVLEQLAATRSFNYLLLPSEIIGVVKVYKSPTADLDEGGIGGTIDVQTRKPLDLKPFAFIGSLQQAYTENSDSYDPNVSALLSWKNPAGNLGILFSGVFDKREIRRDGVEVLGYFNDSTTGLLVPSLIGSALFQQERERKAFNAEMQYRPNDRLEINVNGLYSRFGADNINAELPRLGLAGARRRRHADQRRRARQHRHRRHHHLGRRRHRRARHRLRRHRPLRLRPDLLRRLRPPTTPRATTGSCTSTSATPRRKATPSRSRSWSSARPAASATTCAAARRR